MAQSGNTHNLSTPVDEYQLKTVDVRHSADMVHVSAHAFGCVHSDRLTSVLEFIPNLDISVAVQRHWHRIQWGGHAVAQRRCTLLKLVP